MNQSTVIRGLVCVCMFFVTIGCAKTPEPIRAGPPQKGLYGALIREVGNMLSFPHSADKKDPSGFILDLGDTRDPVAYGYLVDVTRSTDHHCGNRGLAAQALAKIGDPRAFEVIKNAVDSERISKMDAMYAMATLATTANSQEALEYVIQATDPNQDEHLRLMATQRIGGMNPKHPDVGWVIHQLMDSDHDMRVRARAACMLAGHGNEKAWPIIRQAAAGPDPEIRTDVAYHLPLEERTAEIWLDIIDDPAPEVRGAAWEMLDKKIILLTEEDVFATSSPTLDIEVCRAIYRRAYKEQFKNNPQK
ncbi:MAG: hypothetical protein AAGB26_14995 [Planctomycetota bacterium]